MRGTKNARRRGILLLALGILVLPAWGGGENDRHDEPMRLATAQDARRITDDVKVTATVSEAAFRPLEPIRLDVEAENVSTRSLVLHNHGYLPKAPYRRFRILVFDDQGKRLPRTRYYTIDVPQRVVPLNLSRFGSWSFDPGEFIKGKLVANLVYDMTSPGDYAIIVEFPTDQTREIEGEEVSVVAQSEAIPVRVVADPPRLWLQSDERSDEP